MKKFCRFVHAGWISRIMPFAIGIGLYVKYTFLGLLKPVQASSNRRRWFALHTCVRAVHVHLPFPTSPPPPLPSTIYLYHVCCRLQRMLPSCSCCRCCNKAAVVLLLQHRPDHRPHILVDVIVACAMYCLKCGVQALGEGTHACMMQATLTKRCEKPATTPNKRTVLRYPPTYSDAISALASLHLIFRMGMASRASAM